jgi:peptidoglycan/xylan/chitin deacetylase (PgdA/CDA1 family)
MMSRLLNRLRRVRPRRTPQPLILMYHRVADLRVDPWELAVHPDRFDAHLAVVCATRRPLALSEFIDRAKRGTLPADAVALTFDDGYADTLRQARPRLAAAGIPATLFLATAFIGQRIDYWWDELARGILERTAALDGQVEIGGEAFRLALPVADAAVSQSASWRAGETPRTEREQLYYTLWQRLRALRATERDDATARLRKVLQPPPADPDSLPMTESEVRDLAADDLFEIGGHTATHPLLPSLTPDERRRDILNGKTACERVTGKVAVGFAYPHGASDADTKAAVAECGFQWACTTQARPVAASERDWYALPRIAVGNWDRAAFEQALWRAA